MGDFESESLIGLFLILAQLVVGLVQGSDALTDKYDALTSMFLIHILVLLDSSRLFFFPPSSANYYVAISRRLRILSISFAGAALLPFSCMQNVAGMRFQNFQTLQGLN